MPGCPCCRAFILRQACCKEVEAFPSPVPCLEPWLAIGHLQHFDATVACGCRRMWRHGCGAHRLKRMPQPVGWLLRPLQRSGTPPAPPTRAVHVPPNSQASHKPGPPPPQQPAAPLGATARQDVCEIPPAANIEAALCGAERQEARVPCSSRHHAARLRSKGWRRPARGRTPCCCCCRHPAGRPELTQRPPWPGPTGRRHMMDMSDSR